MPATVKVPAFVVKLPLLLKFPLTFNVFVPERVTVAPGLMVILLHTAAALIIGWFVPEVITTLSAAVGTVPEHQFDAVCQSVLVAPVHEPAIQVPKLIIPVAVFGKNTGRF